MERGLQVFWLRQEFRLAADLDSFFDAVLEQAMEMVGKIDNLKWGIVATVAEPRELLLPFVSHHIGCGASVIYIYLDDPDETLATELEQNPKCKVAQCSDSYWSSKSESGKPFDHRLRQTVNANDALKKDEVSWLIHLDADEFLLSKDRISSILSNLDSEIEAARVINDERAFLAGKSPASIFDGFIRREARNSPWLAKLLYGRGAKYIRKGMVGHDGGKTFLKVGTDATMKIHGADREVRSVKVSGIRMLDFDGLTRLHWIDKLYSKSVTSRDTAGHGRSGVREAQIQFAAGPGLVRERMETLFGEIMELSQLKAVLMRFAKLASPIKINIQSELQSAYPDSDLDFSPRNFDVAIATRTRKVLYRNCVFNINLLENFTERLIGVTGGTREEHELDWLTKRLRGKQIVFFDVGANIGLYSVALGHHLDSNSKIVGFECNPILLRRLKMNLADNGLQNTSVCEAALSNTSGYAQLNIISPGNLGQATLGSSSVRPG